jgi:hypothetical protein
MGSLSDLLSDIGLELASGSDAYRINSGWYGARNRVGLSSDGVSKRGGVFDAVARRTALAKALAIPVLLSRLVRRLDAKFIKP